MNKLLPASAAAVALLLPLGGCSKEPAAAPPTSAAAVSSSSAASPSSTPTTASTATSTPGATTVAVDQSTPEAAMTSWLTAMFAGDTTAVCSLMASQGKAIADVPQALETCSSMIGTMLEQLEPLAGAFNGLTIEGATVTGDTATFENVTTQPPMAAQIVSSFKSVRIGGDWYITEG